MPSLSKRGSVHMPSFWSLMPTLNALAAAGTDSHAVSASASARRIRVGEITEYVIGSRGERTSPRTPGRLITDSDSDRHDEPAGLRRGEPGFEGVEMLDGTGIVAADAADANGPVEAPARARRRQRAPP